MKHKFLLNTLAACCLLGYAGMSAHAAQQTAQPATTVNPFSPAYGHAYRHGVMPNRDVFNKMKHYNAQHALTVYSAATGTQTLSYGGGVDGIGVMSGHAKVYIVVYGNQWGSKGTDGNGNATFTGDPDGAVPVAQNMFKGIGTGGELWSAELTQWCDQLPVERQLHSLPERRHPCRCLVRQLRRRAGQPYSKRPGQCGDRRRGTLRQHHGGLKPRRLLCGFVAHRYQPG
jgi:hypothetical protein